MKWLGDAFFGSQAKRAQDIGLELTGAEHYGLHAFGVAVPFQVGEH